MVGHWEFFRVGLETTASPMPLCTNREIQPGLIFAKSMKERQHGKLCKIRGTYQENKDTTDHNLDLEQRLDQEVILKRQLIVDSGASMHMMSKDLTPEEQDTSTVSNKPTTAIAANGIVRTKDLDMLVTVQLLKGSPGVLSLGKLCEDNGSPYVWKQGQAPKS